VSPGLIAARPFTLAAVRPAVFALLRHMKSPAKRGQAAVTPNELAFRHMAAR
jgi:hypothetical protein